MFLFAFILYLVILPNNETKEVTMKAIEKRRLEDLSAIFKALSHPTRLWMVEELMNTERCVCEFVEVSHLDFSTVSKHLSILKQVHIIEDDKRGKNVYYRLEAQCITHIIDCLKEQFINQ